MPRGRYSLDYPHERRRTSTRRGRIVAPRVPATRSSEHLFREELKPRPAPPVIEGEEPVAPVPREPRSVVPIDVHLGFRVATSWS